MIQRDYIQRMIDQLSQVLATLLKLNVPLEKIEFIQKAYLEYLKLDVEKLRAIQPENILHFLSKERQMQTGQLEFLAELLMKEGQLLVEIEAFDEAKNTLQKAQILFAEVEKEQQLFSLERLETLRMIQKLLDQIFEN